nr:hypothetical protein [Tanacetum cinerariifolium]
MLPVELTNEDIKNSEAYKEYYAIALGARPPKTEVSVRKTKSSSDTTITPPTDADIRLSTSAKGKQPAKSSKAKGLIVLSKVAMTKAEQMKLATKRSLQQTHISQASRFGADEGTGSDDANLVLNVGGKEGQDEEDDDEELYRDVNINLEGRDVQMTDVHTTQEFKDTHVTLTSDLLNFGSLFGFDHHLKTLEANFSEFMQTNQFAGSVSSIPRIVKRYMDQRMNEVVKVKVQVSKILPKIKKTMNEQLEAEVLTRSSNSSKTSYSMVDDLSEMELKKILIEKIESNKSIHRSNEQKNLYKALVDAYECDKIILDTYEDTVTLKRRRNDADKDEEPSAGSDRGSKRRREGKEPESTSALKEKATMTTSKSTQGSKSHQNTESAADDQPIIEAYQHPEWFQQQKKPPTPDRAWNKTLPATHESIYPWISILEKQADSRSSFHELMDTPVDFSAFPMNRLKVDTLTLELLAGQQYPHNMLKPLPLIPNSRGRHVIPFDHFINNDLEYLCGVASNRKYTTSTTKTKAADYRHVKWIEDLFYEFAVNKGSARDVYSKRRIIAVIELQIVEWHNYKHLDWITVRRYNDKLYKFKEGDFKRLRIQDIEDMLLLLNKDKQNRLMRIDELHKFSDGTLNDVRTTLDDCLKAKDEESIDPIVQTRKNSDDEGSDDASLVLNVGGKEGHDEEDDDEELYRDININLEGRDVQMTDVHTTQEFKDTHVTLTSVIPDGQQQTQAENEEFLNNHDEKIQKIIMEQVNEQVKVQVSKILPKNEKTMNEQLEAEVLTRSSNSSKTSYAMVDDLFEMELKKILIEKIESNKSIHRSNEQKNLYKALVDAYECDKIILDTYEDTVTLKRRCNDADKDEEPSAGSDRGSKRRREGKEPESTSASKEKATMTTGKSNQGSKSHQNTESDIYPWISILEKQADSRSSFHELMDTPVDFSAFLMNRLKVDTLTLELLAGSTYELSKGSCKSLVELKFFLEEVYKETIDQLEWNNPEGQQYPHNMLKPLPLIPNSRGRHVIPFNHFINNDLEYLRGVASSLNRGSARDVYLKRRIIAVIELQIVEWHNYKHLDWITVRRDNDKLYKFKEDDFKRLRIQDIEDMLLLLNKDKQNRLMRIDELHKFSDGMLNDVRTTLDDYLKGIQIKYLPQAIWKKSDKEKATTMI